MTRLCVASDLGCMLLIPIVTPGPLGHPPEGMKQARPVEPPVRREDHALRTCLGRRDIDVTSERDSE